ncbi:hypothetical protein L596_027935 [Steinernema carpocapsae]|nr:hypothetical protein L596_027935 [Steinernema carpocapsae]
MIPSPTPTPSGHMHHMQQYPSQSLQIPPQSPHPPRHGHGSRLCNGFGGSTEYGIGCTNTWNTETTSAGSYRDRTASNNSRPRSASPRKSPRDSISNGVPHKSRSKSPIKKMQQRTIVHNYDYLQPQCRIEGCTASVVVHDSRFLVCKHQLSHASEYFRSLFLNNASLPLEGVCQNSVNEFAIVVSGLSHPSPSTQFKWFVESVIPTPVLKDITDDTLETCMRLSKRFRAPGLELRCSKHIREFVNYKPPMVALCWLNWCLKHRFDKAVTDACLPSVSRLPLVSLEKHRAMISERILADILAAKLRTCYEQSVSVFQTIHKMDHFTVDVERCPRCGRQREQGKVRIQASPCRKLLGCERCLKDLGCEIEKKSQGDYIAFYQCPHGLMAMSERSEDCHCQLPILGRHLAAIQIIAAEEAEEVPPPPPPRSELSPELSK